MYKFFFFALIVFMVSSCSASKFRYEFAPQSSITSDLSQKFKIETLNFNHGTGPYDKGTQFLKYLGGVNKAELNSIAMEFYPQYFSNASTAIPIDVTMRLDYETDLSIPLLLLYFCSVGTLPAGEFIDIDFYSDVSVYKVLKTDYKSRATGTSLMSCYTPSAWILVTTEKPDKEVAHIDGLGPWIEMAEPTENKRLKRFYLRIIADTIRKSLAKMNGDAIEKATYENI